MDEYLGEVSEEQLKEHIYAALVALYRKEERPYRAKAISRRMVAMGVTKCEAK